VTFPRGPLISGRRKDMRIYRVIGIFIATGLCAKAQDCNVDVHIAVSVRLPMGVMLEAMRTATQMFREIGVNLRIMTAIRAHDPAHACGAPIVVEFEDAGDRPPAKALAYSSPFGKSGPSIHLFLDRILSNGDPRLVSALLAHVMAHEITHIIEKSDGHSEQGIMKAHWSREDYRQMLRRRLAFSSNDVEFIHAALAGVGTGNEEMSVR